MYHELLTILTNVRLLPKIIENTTNSLLIKNYWYYELVHWLRDTIRPHINLTTLSNSEYISIYNNYTSLVKLLTSYIYDNYQDKLKESYLNLELAKDLQINNSLWTNFIEM